MLDTEFRELDTAEIRITGRMLTGLTPEQERQIELALTAGAKMHFEFGPLPAFESARIVLVEPEGRRHDVCSVVLAAGTTH